MSLNELLAGVRVVGVVCNQWGDTGKGKVVDVLAEKWADVIARGTGGANAGHTIVCDGREFIFHLVPSGILHDSKGKVNVIGEGVVLDPCTLVDELSQLDRAGFSCDNLRISHEAKLVLPHHLVLDRAREFKKGTGKIGTTGRGIGPAYEDHVARRGLVVNDLLNQDAFVKKLAKVLENARLELRAMELDEPVLHEIFNHPLLSNGTFYHSGKLFDEPAIVRTYMEDYAKRLAPFISDTGSFMRGTVGKKNILLEGAQGLLLSVDHGTRPYVTSSDPSINGLAKGVGLRERDVQLCLGIVKAYMTRVGGGPFPTELGGKESEGYCNDHSHNKEFERSAYSHVPLNAQNDLERGIALRIKGQEYGATTKRPRRTGWLDLVALRYAVQFNGPLLFLTKADVLDGCEEMRVCTQYSYTGPDYWYGETLLKSGTLLDRFPVDSSVLEHVQPLYTTLKGWNTPTHSIKSFDSLPRELKEFVRFVETHSQGKMCGLSNGPDREDIIFF